MKMKRFLVFCVILCAWSLCATAKDTPFEQALAAWYAANPHSMQHTSEQIVHKSNALSTPACIDNVVLAWAVVRVCWYYHTYYPYGGTKKSYWVPQCVHDLSALCQFGSHMIVVAMQALLVRIIARSVYGLWAYCA
jgi:hypothetical protein